MTVYAYTRVSTIEQAADGKSSLTAQERIIRGFAMARDEPNPVFFTDPGVSGSIPFAKRPSGALLAARLAKGDILYVAKMDRLFRSSLDALLIAKDLQERGIDLVLCDLGADPITHNGASKFFFTVMAAAAEFDKNRIAERTAEGRRGKAARGGHVGGLAPYGWRIAGVGRTAVLEPVESEQAAIAVIKMQSSNQSLRALAAQLASDGFLSRTGKTFAPAQLARILRYAPPTSPAETAQPTTKPRAHAIP